MARPKTIAADPSFESSRNSPRHNARSSRPRTFRALRMYLKSSRTVDSDSALSPLRQILQLVNSKESKSPSPRRKSQFSFGNKKTEEEVNDKNSVSNVETETSVVSDNSTSSSSSRTRKKEFIPKHSMESKHIASESTVFGLDDAKKSDKKADDSILCPDVPIKTAVEILRTLEPMTFGDETNKTAESLLKDAIDSEVVIENKTSSASYSFSSNKDLTPKEQAQNDCYGLQPNSTEEDKHTSPRDPTQRQTVTVATNVPTAGKATAQDKIMIKDQIVNDSNLDKHHEKMISSDGSIEANMGNIPSFNQVQNVSTERQLKASARDNLNKKSNDTTRKPKCALRLSKSYGHETRKKLRPLRNCRSHELKSVNGSFRRPKNDPSLSTANVAQPSHEKQTLKHSESSPRLSNQARTTKKADNFHPSFSKADEPQQSLDKQTLTHSDSSSSLSTHARTTKKADNRQKFFSRETGVIQSKSADTGCRKTQTSVVLPERSKSFQHGSIETCLKHPAGLTQQDENIEK